VLHAVTLTVGLHDLRFVLAAALVCALASSVTLWLHVQSREERGVPAQAWLVCRALAAGSGSWAANLILLMGYAPVSPAGVTLGLLSFTFAISALGSAASFLAAQLAMRATGGSRVGQALSGLSMGAGIVLIHGVLVASLCGTQALQVRPEGLIAGAAVALSICLISRVLGGNAPSAWRGAKATGLMTLALVCQHFLASTSLAGPHAGGFSDLHLRIEAATASAGLSVLVVMAAGAIALVDARAQQRALAQLRTATNAMPAALAFFDADRRLLVWNTTFEQLTAAGGGVVRRGMPMTEMLQTIAPPEVRSAAEAKAQQRETKEFQVPTGKWIRVENVPTDEGILSVGIDITEIKRSEEALAQALERAEAANRATSEFLTNMSHEIRTPLNGVSGLADVLAKTRLTAAQRELIGIIRSSAHTVDSLVGAILDLSSMEAGQAQIRVEPFHLGDLVREAAARHRPGAEAKGLVLVEETAAEAGVLVLGDAARLGQVLSSLLSNAVKFTETGVVRVSARALEGEMFRLEVRDTGVGFDPADKARLFDRFAQGDGSATRKFGGAGLGLALVSRSASLMDATLECDSPPGGGAVFTFDVRLPPARADAAAGSGAGPLPGGRKAGDDAAEEAPLEVLVVDDNATNRRVLELILSQLGATTYTAENGQQAVRAFEAGRFDLVLMDVQMPIMDGLSATREIRSLERRKGLAPTPVIIVSANCMPEHIQAGLEAGAQRYLGKPVTARALAEAIAAVMPSSRKRAAA
jgi:signal transduction histidine kinase/ActR/RegA family two-component response regulator